MKDPTTKGNTLKYFAIVITEATLPLVTALNDGVVPGPEAMNNMFMYPATKPDENFSTIITHEEFTANHVIASAFSISIVQVQ